MRSWVWSRCSIRSQHASFHERFAAAGWSSIVFLHIVPECLTKTTFSPQVSIGVSEKALFKPSMTIKQEQPIWNKCVQYYLRISKAIRWSIGEEHDQTKDVKQKCDTIVKPQHANWHVVRFWCDAKASVSEPILAASVTICKTISDGILSCCKGWKQAKKAGMPWFGCWYLEVSQPGMKVRFCCAHAKVLLRNSVGLVKSKLAASWQLGKGSLPLGSWNSVVWMASMIP